MNQARFNIVYLLGLILAAVVAVVSVVAVVLLALAAVLLPIAPAAAQERASATRVYLPLVQSPAVVPRVERFVSSAATIAPGGEATLSWSVSSATSVRIEPGVGDVSGRTTTLVRPQATTTYTLIAASPAGERRASVTVTVSATQPPPPPPTGAFFLPGEAPTRNFAAAYDAAGTLHLVFVRHTRAENRQELLYGQCATPADCDRFANWRTVVIHSGAIGSVQLAVTGDGRPRLAIQDEYTTINVRLAYMACEANCLSNAGWQGIALARELSYSGVFTQHSDQRWFALDSSGRPHLLIATQEATYYATCISACATNGDGWGLVELDPTGPTSSSPTLQDPVLRVGPDGRVHVVGRNTQPGLIYLTCGGACTEAGSWQRLQLADYSQQGISDSIPVAVYPSALDMELDQAGRLVVAFGGFTPGQNAPNRAYLLRCASTCADAASWSGRPFANTAAFGLNLELDRDDRPYWLLAAATSENGERLVELATCTAGDCYAPSANWQARVLSRSSELEAEVPIKTPAATPPVCSIATTSWEHAANQLLFTPSGHMRLLTNAVGTSICQPGMDEWIDQWGTKKRGRTVDVWVITARARWTIVP
jgi:hypothetical protein